MSKFEVRLCIFAIVFVAIYVGAIAITMHSRVNTAEKLTRIEPVAPTPGEGQVMLAELSKETVRELIGQGAIWPDMSQENIQKEIYILNMVKSLNFQKIFTE